ncbi:ABC transporter ATP-binding protein/permease [Acetobacterium tundrae]|uniref:ABC transporter ATP-binding protein/permease n=1 Tax=Acetobacterium tundrae TaxID=132932 RepID=UPI001FA9CD29|nr:ABC transporter ATP-binding protein/permease [Acetobacterium tundrae]
MNTIISVNQLKKSFDEKQVVKEISFAIEKGEILCLLGPNGAGKSTTINMLCGILGYDGGDMRYQGKNIKDCLNQFKRNLGVVPQDLAIYEDLSAEQNVLFFASLYGLKGRVLEEKVNKALDFSGLLERKKDKAKTFSGGMKRRLNIACAIAHEPELLIMDEPTVGIDPQSRNHILSSIKKLSQQGMTILYTTHYMEEVEEISTWILIMDSGIIMANQILSIVINIFAILGGLLFPMDGYGPLVRGLSYLSPAKWLANTSFSMIYDHNFSWFYPTVLGLILATLVVFIICAKTFRKEDCIC